MSVAEKLSRQCFGKSADPAAPENKSSAEFQAGYKVGQKEADQGNSWVECEREYIIRGLPGFNTPENDALEEWRRGFWAGYFTRLENEQTKGAAGK